MNHFCGIWFAVARRLMRLCYSRVFGLEIIRVKGKRPNNVLLTIDNKPTKLFGLLAYKEFETYWNLYITKTRSIHNNLDYIYYKRKIKDAIFKN